jgi:hypothetical protein
MFITFDPQNDRDCNMVRKLLGELESPKRFGPPVSEWYQWAPQFVSSMSDFARVFLITVIRHTKPGCLFSFETLSKSSGMPQKELIKRYHIFCRYVNAFFKKMNKSELGKIESGAPVFTPFFYESKRVYLVEPKVYNSFLAPLRDFL